MTATVIRLLRSALSTPLPEKATVGGYITLTMHGKAVRNGEPGRITELTDTWLEVRWP